MKIIQFGVLMKEEKLKSIIFLNVENGINYIHNLLKMLRMKVVILTQLEKKCIGAMLGMAIGDAMGARVEFETVDYTFNKIKDMGTDIAGKFKLKPGQWTDDTSLGLCLADSLIENDGKFDGYDLMKRFISWWFYGYNNPFRFDETRNKILKYKPNEKVFIYGCCCHRNAGIMQQRKSENG